MLVKRPKREGNYFRYLKGFIIFEFAALGGSYLLWNRMNHSRDFRYYMHTKFPIILQGFYSIGTNLNPYYDLEAEDKKTWKQENKSL